ncbi:hypothetical protein [Szabonella alba]|uniref:Uncharacterized protein n=1 Tax=Szabonella alba TaxID=2804194 RepID=A0A8K0Y2S3_9RHOB|nr:hypothetical protein [Szabonella alba]MBL4918994.1 hypothetical protein [Szabonella alba]
MIREVTAQVFISTLTEMLESQRALRSLRLRRQNKAHAERFIQTYRNEPDDGLQPLSWPTRSRRMDREAQGRNWAD